MKKNNKLESITKYIDSSVRPQDDFYRYVNGVWLKKAKIPSDKSRWGSFDQLREQSIKDVKEIILTLSAKKHVAKNSPEQMIRDLYATGVDMKRRNKEGFDYVNTLLDKVDKLSTPEQMISLIGDFHTKGINTFWNIEVDLDLKNTSKYTTYISQDGIHLPDRDYYLKKSKDMTAIQNAYKEYMRGMWTLIGVEKNEIEKRIQDVMRIETRLARSMMSKVELRDYTKQYNVYSSSKRAKEYTAINWKEYSKAVQLSEKERVIIMQPKFMSLVDKEFSKNITHELKSYLAWCAVAASAPYTTDKAGILTYELYGKVLFGLQKRMPLWKRVLVIVEGSFGEAIGQIYVKKHFSESAKKKIEKMVKHIISVYEQRIMVLDWMSGKTKKKAVEKLNTFEALLGCPDKWRKYKGLAISSEKSYHENLIVISKYEFKRNIKRLGKKIDKKEWHMTPQTVNAYFSPDRNQIVFPAAIMQTPFFDSKQDDAVNYGAIGMLIGHEMTHGFDDQGSRFDKDGNMKNWWGNNDIKKFIESSQKLVAQFNSYKKNGYSVNGQLTLGENIADLGGLLIAYEAFMKTLSERQKKSKKNGLTPSQRFFIGCARAWREVARDEYIRNALMVDPHAPEDCRVNGPLSNMEEFYEAFDVKEGDTLWRPEEERVKIW